MKKIKITEAQANMLKEMGDDTPTNKLLKVTESQYQKILEMEKMSNLPIQEDELVGVDMPKNKVPSNAVTGHFNKGLDKDVKKQIGKLYEEFINEIYGINEGELKYENLIKLMEVAGLIQNGKINRDKFNNDKGRVKEVISTGLQEMMNGGSNYKVMETMEMKLNEVGGYPAGAEHDPNAPWNQDDGEPEQEPEFLRADKFPFELVYYNLDNDGIAVFSKNGELFIHIAANHDGTPVEDFCADPSGADADCINNFINYNYNLGNVKIGTNPFKDLLSIVTPKNKEAILKYYGDDEQLVAILNNIDETTAASSGAYVGGMSQGNKFDSNVPEELDEVTTTTSVGGSSGSFAYDAPAGDGSDFWTKGNKQNKRMNENQEGRYVAEMDFYIWANSDEEAKGQANQVAKMLDDKFDNRASVTKLVRQPRGTTDSFPVNEGVNKVDKKYKILIENKDVKSSTLISEAKALGINLSEDAQKDTQYPGGGFVEIDDCTKLNNNKVSQNGGCSQGAIDNVVTTKSSSDSVVAKENVYETIAKKTGKTIDEVKAIISKSK